MDYAALKLLHQGAVALSITGFVARGLGSFAGAAWVRGRAARTLPHVVDTVLLLSALALAWMLRLTPGAAPWLAAKIVGLLLYIGLGMLALRPGRPPRAAHRRLAGGAAVLRLDRLRRADQEPAGRAARARGVNRAPPRRLGCTDEPAAPLEPGDEAGAGGHAVPDARRCWPSRHAVGVVAARRRRRGGQRGRAHAHADLPAVAVAGHRRRRRACRSRWRASSAASALLRSGDPERPLFVPWDDAVRARFADRRAATGRAFRAHWAARRAGRRGRAARRQAAAFVDAHRRAGRRHRSATCRAGRRCCTCCRWR